MAPAWAIRNFGRIVIVAMLCPAWAGGRARADGDDANPNVHLNESLTAAELVAKARGLAARGEWGPAARMLDEAAGEYGGALTRVAPELYTATDEAIRRELLTWPADGLAIYRATVDRTADGVLADGVREKNLSGLAAALTRYFCSSSGAAIGDAAGELALEAGEFDLAGRVYRLLATEHPRRGERGANWRAMAAVADELAGHRDTVDAFLAADEAAGSTKIRWIGQDRPVAEVLAEIRNTYETIVKPCADDWPVFGGDLGRNRVSELQVGGFALLWGRDDLSGNQTTDAGRTESIFGFHSSGDPRRLIAQYAVCEQGTILVQDAYHVWAVRAAAGSTVWQYDGTPAEPPSVHDDEDVAPWYAPTLADGRVYAALGGHLSPYYGADSSTGHAGLVCLDAENGWEIWRRDGEASEGSYATIEYDGAPLARGGMVYALERRRRSFGFEDCIVLGLDAHSGVERWRAHLGSASVGGFGERRPTMAVMAAAGDRLYVATNLGAVAAVSTHTGRVAWLRTYVSRPDSPAMQRLPWRNNPVMIDATRAVCYPHDLDAVLVLDRATGDVVREIPAEMLDDLEYVAGVQDGVLYGVGRDVVAYSIVEGRKLWAAALPDDDRLFGRGLLTRSAVLVPLEKRLCAFARATGACTSHDWGSGEKGGNLLALGDRLVVVGQDRLAMYTEVETAWEALRARMAESKASPAAALDVAELALHTDRLPQAGEALEEAVGRMASVESAAAAQLGRRVFDDHLALADALIAKGGAEQRSRAIGYYQGAQRWAPDAAGRLKCRLPLAKALLAADRPGRVVDVYQEILANAEVRGQVMATEPGQPAAGRWCAGRIAELIATHGGQVYARHAQVAANTLAQAKVAGDVEMLRRIADVFPNADAGRAALVELGDALNKRGEHRAARRAYGQYLDAMPGESTAATVIARIAECARAEGRPLLAARWLKRGGLEASSTESVRRAPHWSRIPGNSPTVHTSSGGGAELLAGATDAARCADRFFVYVDNGIRAFAVGEAKPLWDGPAACARAATPVYVDDTRAVFATGFELFAVDVRTGKRLWTAGAEPEGVDAPGSDPEDFPRHRYFLADSGRIMAIRADGGAIAVELQDGTMIWTRTLQYAPFGTPVLKRDWLVYPSARFSESVVCICDARTGRAVHVAASPDGQPASGVAVTDDDRVLVVAATGVAAFDPTDRRQVWRWVGSQRLNARGVLADLDGVYVSADGRGLSKLSLWDGSPIWEKPSERIGRADQFSLAVVGDRVVLATADEVSAYACATGERVARWQLDADARIDRWEFLDDGFVGLRFAETDALGVQVFDFDRGESPPQARYHLSTGRADAALICDDGLVVSGGGSVVSFTASPRRNGQ